jgi:hypothetical protein
MAASFFQWNHEVQKAQAELMFFRSENTVTPVSDDSACSH